LSENSRPIIGIVAYDVDGSETSYGKYYIAASYVKFIESAGGRVVPIMYDATQSELLDIFGKINGVLFPGGASDISVGSPIYNTAKYLYDLAIAANDQGDYFPMQGHCMGFQLLSQVVSQNGSILSQFDSENLSLPLNFYDTYKQSRIFGNSDIDPEIIDILSKQPVTMNNHHYGVTPEIYETNPALSTFFRIISWNTDRANKAFISSVEAFKYPIYALQWHPEKVAFEWSVTEGIDHSSDSVEANQYVAEFFLSEARKSTHSFSSPQEEYKSLIYNYSPVYTSSFDNSFTQIYFFP